MCISDRSGKSPSGRESGWPRAPASSTNGSIGNLHESQRTASRPEFAGPPAAQSGLRIADAVHGGQHPVGVPLHPALLPVGTLICIMGGGGALKQIIVDSGVGSYAGNLLMTSAISPLLVVWLIAAAMRLAQGSATVAIITAAGIAAPLVKGIPGYTPTELILALCAGGSAFSHVSDSGFWLVTQYFGMTVPQSLKTWTTMKMIAAILGLVIVMTAHALLR